MLEWQSDHSLLFLWLKHTKNAKTIFKQKQYSFLPWMCRICSLLMTSFLLCLNFFRIKNSLQSYWLDSSSRDISYLYSKFSIWASKKSRHGQIHWLFQKLIQTSQNLKNKSLFFFVKHPWSDLIGMVATSWMRKVHVLPVTIFTTPAKISIMDITSKYTAI